MLKVVRNDLEDICDSLEHLIATLPRLTREEQVDLAARVRAVAKSAKLIDETIKDNIKSWRRHKEGYVNGELFKAYLSLVSVTYLDQTKLKVEEPDIYAKYCAKRVDERVTFETR